MIVPTFWHIRLLSFYSEEKGGVLIAPLILMLTLNTFLVAAVTHSDVGVVAAEHDLAALGDDAALLVDSGVYTCFLSTGADRLDLGDRVR